MAYGKELVYTKEGNIGIIMLNRPDNFNLCGPELFAEMLEIQDDIEKDDTIRCVLIKAAGPHFSAGIDLKILNEVNSQYVMESLHTWQRVYGRWQEWAIPVIIAVHGICYGSAVEMMLGCDIRIAADDCRLSIPEVRFGLSPDMGGTTRLTQLVGMGQAKRLILGCEEITAQEALQIGLVEIVVPRDQLEARAVKLVKKIAGMPPLAVRFAKKGINVANESSVASSLFFEQAQSIMCCGSQDMREGIAAFFEKRPPVFQNK